MVGTGTVEEDAEGQEGSQVRMIMVAEVIWVKILMVVEGVI